MPRNEAASRGRFTFDSADYQKIKFESDENDVVIAIRWCYEIGVPDGELFKKDPPKSLHGEL